MKEYDFDKATRHLLAQVEINGVAAVKVNDGEVFAFSRKKIAEIQAAMDNSNQETVIVFVKTGPEVSKVEEN